jgi:hypothetical protein
MKENTGLEQRITRRELFKRLGIGGAAALVASYPLMIERYLLEINTYSITLPRLPAAFDGFRIVQLTDLHMGFLTPPWFIQKVIDLANGLEKDITVFTGDAVQSGVSDDEIRDVWQRLAGLHAPLGVYATFGNHDHWIGFEKSLYWAEQVNLSFRHQSKRLERDGQSLWLGGFGDFWEDDLGAEDCFTGANPDDCKIALSHNPDSADVPLPYTIDLYICGHTHGGQINLPYIREAAAPIHNKAYIAGLVQTANSQVFISRGIGWGGYPLRFRCPPEIAILELRRG